MFTILKQIHPFGCIPACAASVMQHLQIPGNWTEMNILNMYNNPQGSGFDTLKIFLEQNGLPIEWGIQLADNKVEFKTFIIDKNLSNIPLLCPVNQGPNNNAHCVVVADSNENNLIIYDPASTMPNSRIENYESFFPKWAGSFLWFEKV